MLIFLNVINPTNLSDLTSEFRENSNEHKEDMFLFQTKKAKLPKGIKRDCPGHDYNGSCCDCGNNEMVNGTCNGFKTDGSCCPVNQTIDECCPCGKTNFSTNTYHCYPQYNNGQCCHDYAWWIDFLDFVVRFECCDCGTHVDDYLREVCNEKDAAGHCCAAYYEDGTCCPSGHLYDCNL